VRRGPSGLLAVDANPGVGLGSTQSATYPEYFNGVIDEVSIRDDAEFGTTTTPSTAKPSPHRSPD
jgi:hypothetical protein